MDKSKAIELLRPHFKSCGLNQLFILPNGSWYTNESFAINDATLLGVKHIGVTREEAEKTVKK